MTLTDFVLTGQLGPVSVGASATELIALLGRPERSDDQGPRRLAWESLCLSLDPTDDDTVETVCIRVVDGEFRFPKALQVTWDPLLTMRSKEHIDWHLQREQIRVEEHHAIDLTMYTSDSGVTLYFGRDESHGPDTLYRLIIGATDRLSVAKDSWA
jgi:hypothetical protein